MSKMPPFDWREWATKSSGWAGQDANLAFEEFIERKWLDAINIAATEPTPWKGDGEKAASKAYAPDRAHGGEKGAMKLTGAVNVVEQGEAPRSPSPYWSFTFRKKCRARNLIGCDGNHVILRCEKLHGMKLAERREVVEKSGLCTFCLRHGAELECYAKEGLAEPKCARLGCNGEHATLLHDLLGEADAAVNLVAGGDGEAAYDHESGHEYQYEWDCDGPWVGTVGAMEVPEEASEPAGEVEDQDAALCTDSAKEGEEEDQWGYESLWVGTIGAMEMPREMDEITNIITTQRSPQEDDRAVTREETTEDEGEQWDSEADWSSKGSNVPRTSRQGSPRRPHGGLSRAPRPAQPSRPVFREKSETAADQMWEEARRNAWLRQLLSDDSSDESDNEEKYGRFAESGRWMAELYGIPQHPATTMGGECSA
jgi:hypothetical protein